MKEILRQVELSENFCFLQNTFICKIVPIDLIKFHGTYQFAL